jgi:frataxin-like iron-binding protein CyaY
MAQAFGNQAQVLYMWNQVKLDENREVWVSSQKIGGSEFRLWNLGDWSKNIVFQVEDIVSQE